MMQEKQYKREVARKTSISAALEAGDGEEFQAKRVNVLATVIGKEDGQAYKSCVIDDGSGQIKLRFFDNEQRLFGKAGPGDFVLAIGKLRRYGEETYIAPEILKVICNLKWAEVRKLELKAGKTGNPTKAAEAEIRDPGAEKENADVVSRDKVGLYRIIRELDAGRGADIGEVTAKFGNAAELLIREMIKNGDVFEVLPGRLKVLE